MSKLTLTEPERTELRERESRIETRIQGFVECGNELLAIRDSKLYREYGTFQEYCRERWELSRPQAYRLVQSAEVIANLSPIGDKKHWNTNPADARHHEERGVPLPTKESQARPLAALKDKVQQREAWTAAVESSGGKPTAKHVEAAVEVVKARNGQAKRDPEEKYVLSVGLQYAEMAIASLSNIQRNDTQREAAFAKVSKWLIKNK